MLRLLLITSLIILCSCQNAGKQSSRSSTKKTQTAPAGNPMLKDYVKIPLDKAKLASKINDKHNRKIEEQVKELDQ